MNNKKKLKRLRHWQEDQHKRESAIRDSLDELKRASLKHRRMKSPHEGISILREEFEELWDEVKKKEKNQSKKRFRAEAKQVVAMGLRFIIDLT